MVIQYTSNDLMNRSSQMERPPVASTHRNRGSSFENVLTSSKHVVSSGGDMFLNSNSTPSPEKFIPKPAGMRRSSLIDKSFPYDEDGTIDENSQLGTGNATTPVLQRKDLSQDQSTHIDSI